MMSPLLFLFLLATIGAGPSFGNPAVLGTDQDATSRDVKDDAPTQETRQCSKNLTNLWLDLVFVLDSSMGVNRHDFIFQKAMILGLLDEIKVSQEVGPFSRIAFINVGAEAHRVSNLTTYNDNQEARDALKQRTPFLGDRNVNLGAGLIEVQKMLDESDTRPNVRNLVVLFSSRNVNCEKTHVSRVGESHPCRIAAAIQQRGTILLTVALRFHETRTSPILQLGNPCFATKNDLSFRDNFNQMALRANCFCHEPYKQIVDEDNCQSYGECVYLAESPTVYSAAKDGCEMDDAVMADVFDQHKENFLEHRAVENAQTPFWIGLSGTYGTQRFKPTNSTSSDHQCMAITETPEGASEDFQWLKMDCSNKGPTLYYFCQREACDADHYCD